MKHFLGIDIGTSGAKVLALAEDGSIAAIAQQEYPLSTPQPLWAEQDPQLWWDATQHCIRKVLLQSLCWFRDTFCRKEIIAAQQAGIDP